VYEILRISVKWQPSCSTRTDGKTYVTKLIGIFGSFEKSAYKTGNWTNTWKIFGCICGCSIAPRSVIFGCLFASPSTPFGTLFFFVYREKAQWLSLRRSGVFDVGVREIYCCLSPGTCLSDSQKFSRLSHSHLYIYRPIARPLKHSRHFREIYQVRCNFELKI